MFIVPDLELKALNLAVNAENELQEEDIKSADKNVLWTINYDRFNREFRDQVRRFLKMESYNVPSNFYHRQI
jgi:hypothetical protein